jgi:hypothetical protein
LRKLGEPGKPVAIAPSVSSSKTGDACPWDTLGTRRGQPYRIIPGMLYAAKCYWPGVSKDVLVNAAERAGEQNKAGDRAVFRGLLYLPGDETALSLFEADSPASVKQASESVGMPCERVIATVWVAPHPTDVPRCAKEQ